MKKIKFVDKRAFFPDAMVSPTDDMRKICPPKPSVLVALPFKLGVSLTEINVVFSALYLSLVWMHRLKIN
jgi:hypothetical protein